MAPVFLVTRMSTCFCKIKCWFFDDSNRKTGFTGPETGSSGEIFCPGNREAHFEHRSLPPLGVDEEFTSE